MSEKEDKADNQYPKGIGIETVVYVDSDHARDYVDRKSTSGICTFVGCCLTSWFLKKQTALAISTTEAEYISAEKACQQALRMKQALIDYDNIPILCDNKGAIDLSKNPGQMLIEFVIHNQFFSFTIEEFGQILGIPTNGACSFTDKRSLDNLQYSVPTSGPYQTNPPCLDPIKNYVQEEQEGSVNRIRHKNVNIVEENEILSREIVTVMKYWVEIIRENVFCLGANWDHVSACLCHMLYCITSHGVLDDYYDLHDRVMYPLTTQQERKTQKDYGMKGGLYSTSSFFAFGQPSSYHLNDDDDDDDGNDEGTLRASTPSPTDFVNSLTNELPQVFENPPNIDPWLQSNTIYINIIYNK
nr:retrovirus-related Pol polyprotein from transposon TNT 1-94 [Tanacetum cinerariifolium]